MDHLLNPYRHGAAGYTIDNAGLFNGSTSKLANTSPTPGDAAGTKTCTIFAWMKLAGLTGTTQRFISFDDGAGADEFEFAISASGEFHMRLKSTSDSTRVSWTSTRVIRDFSAAAFFCMTLDTTPGTPILKVWCNDVEITDWTKAVDALAQDDTFNLGSNLARYHIGVEADGDGAWGNGYMAQVGYMDAVVITDPVTAGLIEIDSNGVPVPVDVSVLSFGTGGFLYEFGNGADLGEATVGDDATATNVIQVTDTPTNNQVTWNALDKDSTHTLTNGNLTASSSSASQESVRAGMGVSSGKWYWEIERTTASAHGQYGIATSAALLAGDAGLHVDAYAYRTFDGQIANNGGQSAYGNATGIAVSEVVGVALDMDNGACWWCDNGTWVDGDGTDSSATVLAEIEAGTTTSSDVTGLTKEYFPMISNESSNTETARFNSNEWTLNTGSGSAPDGFSAVAPGNLPAPAVPDVEDDFVESLDSETNIEATVASARSGFTNYVDYLVNRDSSENRIWRFSHDNTNEHVQATTTTHQTIVAVSGADLWRGWSMKVGGAADIKAGSVTTSGADASVTGLSLPTDRCIIILFPRTAASEAVMFHPDLDAGKLISITATRAQTTDATIKNVTTDGFDVDHATTGNDTFDYLVVPEVPGFCAMGLYEGNASADGPMIYAGVKPVLFWVHNIDAVEDFGSFSGSVDTYNQAIGWQRIETTNAETSSIDVDRTGDFLSNGFKNRGAGNAAFNATNTYAWWMIGSPFGGSGVAPATAR